MGSFVLGQASNAQLILFDDTYDVIDTVIERNNPTSLDLSKHQLFIDTTRTFPFYDQIENRTYIDADNPEWNEWVYSNFGDSIFQHFNFGNFPRQWLVLNKYQDEFIFYKRCDGNHPAYEFNDSLFFIIGTHEGDCRKILNVMELENHGFVIELGVFSNEGINQNISFSFLPTERIDIYKMVVNFDGMIYSNYVTPKEYVRNFDALVNHCPTNKVIEFDEVLDDFVRYDD